MSGASSHSGEEHPHFTDEAISLLRTIASKTQQGYERL
jgi:hypothetical protein